MGGGEGGELMTVEIGAGDANAFRMHGPGFRGTRKDSERERATDALLSCYVRPRESKSTRT